MRSVIQSTPAYELRAEVNNSVYGYSFRLASFVPIARQPQEHTQFQATFSRIELLALRDLVDGALSREGVEKA